MPVKTEKSGLFGAWIPVILPVIFLTSLGMLILMSAGAGGDDPYSIVRRQSVWLVIAVAAGCFAAFVDLKFLKKISIPFAIVSMVLLLLAVVGPFAKEVNGSHRWIDLKIFAVQSSDIAKFSFIILLSSYLYDNQRRMGTFWYGLVKPLAITGIFCVLIIIEPDYGTTAVVGAIGFVLIFLAGAKKLYLGAVCVPAILGFAVMVYHDPVRLNRVLSFLDLENTKTEGGYQLYQGILAFGSGKLTGLGIGQGRQQLAFLPEAHTDFVFAIVGEELGLVGTYSVVTAFLILFLAGLWNLRKAPNLYEFSLAMGALLMIVVQAISNMCVVTGLMPTKGISLPFISYGGSNLVAMFVFTGLLINCIRAWSKPAQIRASEL